jgi:hypothetical protein
MGGWPADVWRGVTAMIGAGYEGGEAVPTGLAPKCAEIAAPALLSYPFAGIATTEYAARIIAARCHVSPRMARQIAEIIGMGGAA